MKQGKQEKRRSKPNGDRRVDIADAALEIIAREGARHLTHRAIDRRLGIPEGTTSYYCRTKKELLEATLDRLLELDLADLKWMLEIAQEPPEAVDVDRIAELLGRTFVDWLSPRKRKRTLARCELMMEGARKKTARKIESIGWEQIRGHLTILLSLIGAKHPREAANATIAYGFGLVYGYAISEEVQLDQRQIKDVLRQFITMQKNA